MRMVMMPLERVSVHILLYTIYNMLLLSLVPRGSSQRRCNTCEVCLRSFHLLTPKGGQVRGGRGGGLRNLHFVHTIYAINTATTLIYIYIYITHTHTHTHVVVFQSDRISEGNALIYSYYSAF